MTHTDKELLEWAARAVGQQITEYVGHLHESNRYWAHAVGDHRETAVQWNPLQDDGDCARLETNLRFLIRHSDKSVIVTMSFPMLIRNGTRFMSSKCWEEVEDHAGDMSAARRRASTRLAAEIGKAIP